MSAEQSDSEPSKPDQPQTPATLPAVARLAPAQLTATDREFLPAALEIVVTPPSPIARTLC